ncbi:MAG: hypothetical protein ABIK92_15795 [Pseudomonadota bacterium]
MNDMEKTLRLRRAVGKVAAILCVIVCFSLIDTIIAGFRQSATEFDVLPGTSIELNGLTAEKVKSGDEIVCKSSSDYIRISIDSLQKGHWFGNNMWHGHLIISPDAKAGEYSIIVGIKDINLQKKHDKFLVRVYKDYAKYQQSFKSVIKRYIDISPWVFAASFSPFIILAFGYIFILSGKIENLMAKQKKAVIYKVKKAKETCEIYFGLGMDHGIKVSTCLTVFNDKGQPVGTAVVNSANGIDSIACAESGCLIKPGYIVSVS